jgi:hemerythrin
MLFVWDDNYRTGVDEIDHDHKGLVNLINDLYEAMQDGSGGALLLLHGGSLRQRRTLHG